MNAVSPVTSDRKVDPDLALRVLAQATASTTGEEFFRALVLHLSRVMGTYGAWVTQFDAQARRLRGLAFKLGDGWVENYEAEIDGTPCQLVVEQRKLVHVADRLADLYPIDPDVKALGAVSYLGVPLLDTDGRVLGHLAVLDLKPIPPDPQLLDVFQIFAARAAAEQQRLAAEARLREREEKLARLFETAMDAILDLDGEFVIIGANSAAGRVFGCASDQLVGRSLMELLTAASARRLLEVSDAFANKAGGEGSLWLPEALCARRADGETFTAEASVSRYRLRGRAWHTLILRDVEDRVAAQQAIASLSAQAQYLADELKALHNCDQILGESAAMNSLLGDIQQVGPTGASVLITGETGTGKELIARAIHAASPRAGKPLIRVNCAAIPANLMESEFFGHEKGAFTGATARREGRFSLADGGTLFLDEVAELPIELQGKLLQALQEGEFEPVGSTRTMKVDVRVIAATNRDLTAAIKAGQFREDLYYRLNVFPLRVPALRQRGRDIDVLAKTFAARAAQRVGKSIAPLAEEDLERLRSHNWPGNVRELENVMELAVITASDGRVNLDRALPRTGVAAAVEPVARAAAILTAGELEELERQNLLRALEQCGGRIAGRGGAAELLNIKPSTLRSKLKALGVDRPAEH